MRLIFLPWQLGLLFLFFFPPFHALFLPFTPAAVFSSACVEHLCAVLTVSAHLHRCAHTPLIELTRPYCVLAISRVSVGKQSQRLLVEMKECLYHCAKTKAVI